MTELFGNDTSNPLLQSLNSKFFFHKNVSTIVLAAYERDTCSIERMNDVKLIINDKYTRPDGIPMVRAIPECPRSYYTAYVVKKGWPFTDIFNGFLIQLFEAGLLNKWYKDTENAIIAQNLIEKPVGGESNFKAYSLYDMQIAFYILIVGHFISGLTLILEVFIYSIFGRNKHIL